mmetsp:Transcript_107773/g.335086  ORF Transcript_107773/g.335086 Transcript_107773/m.335086 type:complete len:263 (+) Transcript_107773:1620-2408(+)
MAQHVWPLLKKAALKTPSAVARMSQSGRMIAASLPPSSSRMRLKSLEHAAMTLLPIAVEPVKTTLRTIGCRVRISPGLGKPLSLPTTTFSTPGGNAFRSSSPIRRVVSGVCGAGFNTTVLPQASAQDVGFQPSTMGAFHGAITATTPKGLRRTTTRLVPSSEISSSPPMSRSRAAASKPAAATMISSFVSGSGLPLSFVCSVANGSMFSRSKAAHAMSLDARCACGNAAQRSDARWAASTALSSCERDASGARPTRLPVAGL